MPGSVRTLSTGNLQRLSPGDFERLGNFIYETCGIRITDGKKTMLEARLQKRLRHLGMDSFADYCRYIFGKEGEKEVVPMIDLVTTNKTDFFREPEHFVHLRDRVLPEWLAGRGAVPGRVFHAWSAGSSTGEEPYTLAMVLQEFALENPGFDFRVLATDISTAVVEKAHRGIYDEERIEPVPAHLKRKYFLRSRDRNSGLVRVVPELRQKVRFRRLNFMEGDYGLRESMDAVFCRNVIIYFDRPTQERFLGRLCRHLLPGGHLFVGHSETLTGLDIPVTQVRPTVYRRNG